MLKRIFTFIVCLFVFGCFAWSQQVRIDSSVYHDLQRSLAATPYPADSLDITTNIFDLGFDEHSVEYGEKAYWLAQNLGEIDMTADLIVLLTDCYRDNPKMLNDLIRRAGTLPNDNNKREILTYLSLCKSIYEANHQPEDRSIDRMKELTLLYMTSPTEGDQYVKIQRLFELCIYLHAMLEQSVLLSNYFDTLGKMVEQLPLSQTSLRKLYYSLASETYSKQLMQEKAAEMDLCLIDLIKKQRSYYASHKRFYRTFDRELYVVDSHLLSNYEVLTEQEADSVYDAITAIAARNSVVASMFETDGLPQVYHYMANGDYAAALPLLKKHIGSVTDDNTAAILYRAMITAAGATGDWATYRNASKEYIKLLEKYIHNRTAHSLTELAITYDLNEARAEAEARQNELQQSNFMSTRHRMIYTFTVSVLLLVLLVVFVYLWRRKRNASVELKKAVDELKQERDNLQRMQSDLILARDQAKVAERQKTDFIHMISHQVKTPLQAITEYTGLIVDCMDDVRKKYLGRYAEVVKLNTELINTMVNDITDVSALEADEVGISIQPADLHDICAMAIDSLRPMLNPDQRLELLTDAECTIATDRRRLEQILSNLLENAVKFSERGVISVAYKTDDKHNLVEIAVSDQGPGIPAAKQDAIFDRFVKLDNNMPGMGLGLYVTRLLTRLMGGEVHLDLSYKGGARFVVTLHAKSK